MNRLIVSALSAIPNPSPQAPDDIEARTNKALGFLKWASLVGLVAALIVFGLMVFGSERGGHGSRSAELKERFGTVVVGAIVVAGASSIVSFLVG